MSFAKSYLFALFLIVAMVSSLFAQLELEIKVRTEEGSEVGMLDIDESFEVIFKNVSNEKIMIPEPDSDLGREGLAFIFSDGTYNWRVDRGPLLGNDKTTLIMPEDYHVHYVSLGEDRWNEWKWRNLPNPNTAQSFQLTA